MTTISQQLLELQSLNTAQLAGRYAELHGQPPRIKNRALLLRRVAWKLQELAFGGLPERAKNRLDEMIAAIDLPLRDPTPPQPRATQRGETRGPMVGTTLIRKWHDSEIRVEAREGGFEWNGTIYKSLSAVAKAITGANWNGKLFFGLTQRKAGA
jgi:hypothetical protein